MAVLEKIRKRSVLLFIIIIGALLAFILGDFLNSGRSLFGPGDTVASVDNVKVKQMDLNEQSENVENYMKNMRAYGQNISADWADPDYRYQQALDAALYQKLMAEELERLGIKVTDDFISQYVANPTSSNDVWQILISQFGANGQETLAYLQQNGIVDPSTYLDAIKNPARYRLDDATAASLAGAWQKMETNLARQTEYNLYNNMLSSMVQPNKADAKAYFDNQNILANVRAASVPMSTVSDSEITVEDSDIEAVYNTNKGAYEILDETREVAYILVPITPSNEDVEKANAATKALVADLMNSEGIQTLANHKGFIHKTEKITKEELGKDFKYAPLRMDSAGIGKGTVKELFSNTDKRSVAKVLDVTTGIEKVVYSFYPVENQHEADSLFANKSVEAVDSVIKALSGGQLVNMQASLVKPDNTGYAGAFASVDNVAEALKSAPLNQYYFVADTVSAQPLQGVLVVKERGESVPVYELEIMDYEIYASEKTRQDLTQQLHNYVANNPTAAQFANDTTGNYNVRFSLIDPNKYTLDKSQITPNTRALVKWALDAKKGAVSPVFSRQRTVFGRGDQPDETQDYLIAVAVVDIYDDFVPYTSQLVKDNLKGRATTDKKAKVLIDKYNGKGKNINEYATAMGVTPQNMNIAFGAGSVGGAAQGKLAAAKKGDVVGPVQGGNAVYVFQVDEVTTPDFNSVDLQTRLNEAGRAFRTPQQGLSMLIGSRKINNNLIKYFTADPTAE